MKLENWLIITAPTVILLISLFALYPDDYWDVEDESRSTSTMPSPGGAAPDDGGWFDNLSNLTGPATPTTSAPRSVQVAAIKPQVAPRTTKAQPGLMNFEQAPRKRFEGTVQQVSELQRRDGQIHVWVTDAAGMEQEISVAPSWFLSYIGCTIAHDIPISGVGFYFDQGRKDPLLYVRKMVVNGKTCQLRNDEGFALWSNQLR